MENPNSKEEAKSTRLNIVRIVANAIILIGLIGPWGNTSGGYEIKLGPWMFFPVIYMAFSLPSILQRKFSKDNKLGRIRVVLFWVSVINLGGAGAFGVWAHTNFLWGYGLVWVGLIMGLVIDAIEMRKPKELGDQGQQSR